MSDVEFPPGSGNLTPAPSFATGDGGALVGHGTAQSPLIPVGWRGLSAGPSRLVTSAELAPLLALRAGADNAAELAIADGTDNGNVVGVVPPGGAVANSAVEYVLGLCVAATALWNAITSQLTGLTPGAIYYLSQQTPGHLTTVRPGSGQIVQVGIALSPTAMQILPQVVSQSGGGGSPTFPVQTFAHSFNVVLEKTNVLTTADDAPIATLPAAAASGNGAIAIVKLLGTPGATIAPHAGDTIDGLASLALAHDLDFAQLVSDGASNWIVIAAGQVAP